MHMDVIASPEVRPGGGREKRMRWVTGQYHMRAKRPHDRETSSTWGRARADVPSPPALTTCYITAPPLLLCPANPPI